MAAVHTCIMHVTRKELSSKGHCFESRAHAGRSPSSFQNHHLSSKAHLSLSLKARSCPPAHPLRTQTLAGNSLNKGDSTVDYEHTLLLKKRASEIVADLRGTCIYLVGMMGSGKTTVGKLLAEVLDYHFIDSDQVIEDVAGGVPVAQIFKIQDEESFRDTETEVLKQMSCNGRLVVATGGGIVIRPVNWSYLRYGVTVWLDVPLETLAERVVAVGTHSRPLLYEQSKGNSTYSQALARLTSIFESRASCYANSDARVCIQKLASSLGYHVRDLTPTIIAAQVLAEISSLIIQKKQSMAHLIKGAHSENFVEGSRRMLSNAFLNSAEA